MLHTYTVIQFSHQTYEFKESECLAQGHGVSRDWSSDVNTSAILTLLSSLLTQVKRLGEEGKVVSPSGKVSDTVVKLTLGNGLSPLSGAPLHGRGHLTWQKCPAGKLDTITYFFHLATDCSERKGISA